MVLPMGDSVPNSARAVPSRSTMDSGRASAVAASPASSGNEKIRRKSGSAKRRSRVSFLPAYSIGTLPLAVRVA